MNTITNPEPFHDFEVLAGVAAKLSQTDPDKSQTDPDDPWDSPYSPRAYRPGDKVVMRGRRGTGRVIGTVDDWTGPTVRGIGPLYLVTRTDAPSDILGTIYAESEITAAGPPAIDRITQFALDILGDHVELTAAGADSDSLKGLCPVHGEKGPARSFHVKPSAGLWHCFGCGNGGDVAELARRLDNPGHAVSRPGVPLF